MELESSTAEYAAAMRALHQTLDGPPKILDDPLAARLVDPSSASYKAALGGFDWMPAAVRSRYRAMFVVRSRYAEDSLAEAVRRGVRQYVLLGAGLDTFAYRQPSWGNGLRIFEVDHRATQEWKRERLAKARITIPSKCISPQSISRKSP